MVKDHDGFRFLTDSVAMALSAIEPDENVKPIKINEVENHCVSAKRTLKRDRNTVANWEVLMAMEAAMVWRTLSGCINSCGTILCIVRGAPGTPLLPPQPGTPAPA